MLPTERIGRATWLLAQGRSMTVREVADALEITPRGARAMLERLSRVVPLVDDGGLWRVVPLVDDGGLWRVASEERTASDGEVA